MFPDTGYTEAGSTAHALTGEMEVVLSEPASEASFCVEEPQPSTRSQDNDHAAQHLAAAEQVFMYLQVGQVYSCILLLCVLPLKNVVFGSS